MQALFKFGLVSVFLISASAHGQVRSSITTTAINDPMATLALFKELYQPEKPDPKNKYFAVSTCIYSDDPHPERAYQFVDSLRYIANTEMRLADELARNGYPESVWRDPLDNVIRQWVAVLQERLKRGEYLGDRITIRKAVLKYERELLAVLEKYRKQSNQKLPRYELSEGGSCGADWIGMLRVQTIPPKGVVKLIREHFFQLCARSKPDPYSAECDMWLLAGPDSHFPQGTYRYLARWGSGAEECNKIDLIGKFPSPTAVLVMRIQETKQPCVRQ